MAQSSVGTVAQIEIGADNFDEAANELDFFYAGPNSAPDEPCFAPKSTAAAEGVGWRAENRTDPIILDALNLSSGPVAIIKFPCRVLEGFHGTFVPANRLSR